MASNAAAHPKGDWKMPLWLWPGEGRWWPGEEQFQWSGGNEKVDWNGLKEEKFEGHHSEKIYYIWEKITGVGWATMAYLKVGVRFTFLGY